MGYDVRIRRQKQSTVIDLKGSQKGIRKWIDDPSLGFPSQPNTACASGDTELYWIGIEHYLLRAPIGRERDFLVKVAPQSVPAEISAVLVSDMVAFFEIAGADAREVMAIASPLDLHPGVFPINGVSYTEAFGLKGLIIRRAGKKVGLAFELAVESSYADMIQDFLDRVA